MVHTGRVPADFDGVEIGLTRGTVRIVDSDPGWPGAFEKVIGELRRALGGWTEGIEPIGSAAVPGLAAKPILDVAVALAAHTQISDVHTVLTRLGYHYGGDAGAWGGHIFALEDRPDHRLVTLHAVRHDDPQWARYLIVRDRLRRDPTARRAYAALKRRLAAEYPSDRQAYTSAKTAFITDLLA